MTDEAASIADRDRLAEDKRVVLVFAALRHDFGKLLTTETIDGRIRSHGPCDTVEIFQAFLARIRAPFGKVERVIALYRYHLTHFDFKDSLRHVQRLLGSLGATGETLEQPSRLLEADHKRASSINKKSTEHGHDF